MFLEIDYLQDTQKWTHSIQLFNLLSPPVGSVHVESPAVGVTLYWAGFQPVDGFSLKGGIVLGEMLTCGGVTVGVSGLEWLIYSATRGPGKLPISAIPPQSTWIKLQQARWQPSACPTTTIITVCSNFHHYHPAAILARTEFSLALCWM